MSIGARCVTALGFVVLVTSLVWVSREEERRQIFRDRNFYGVLAIREYDVGTQDHHWGLRDGRISHGEQSVTTTHI